MIPNEWIENALLVLCVVAIAIAAWLSERKDRDS